MAERETDVRGTHRRASPRAASRTEPVLRPPELWSIGTWNQTADVPVVSFLIPYFGAPPVRDLQNAGRRPVGSLASQGSDWRL